MPSASKLIFNREAAMNHIMGNLAIGVGKSLDAIEEIAWRLAPVGKGNKRSRAYKGEKLSVFKQRQNENELSPGRRQTVIRNANKKAKEYNRTNPRKPLAPITRLSSSIALRRRQEATNLTLVGAPDYEPLPSSTGSGRKGGQVFTIRFQNANGDEAPSDTVAFREGKLRKGIAVKRGGNLRSKIKRTPLTTEGHRVSGKVISGAPYSRYVEWATRRNKAQPFMRPAIHEFEANWRSFFKG